MCEPIALGVAQALGRALAFVRGLLGLLDGELFEKERLHTSPFRNWQLEIVFNATAVTELGVAPPSGEEIGGRKPRMKETNFEEFLSFQSAVPAGCAARTRRRLGVLIATSHFAGIRHLEKAKKNLKPPAAPQSSTCKKSGCTSRMSHLKQETALPSTEHMFLVGVFLVARAYCSCDTKPFFRMW